MNAVVEEITKKAPLIDALANLAKAQAAYAQKEKTNNLVNKLLSENFRLEVEQFR